eukprot:1040735-Rhodomonas_salina.1
MLCRGPSAAVQLTLFAITCEEGQAPPELVRLTLDSPTECSSQGEVLCVKRNGARIHGQQTRLRPNTAISAVTAETDKTETLRAQPVGMRVPRRPSHEQLPPPGELDARGYPLDAGSTVRARCGHHFCSECLLERVSGCAPHEYRCEHVGCGQHVADFAIRRNSGTEPFTTECAWGRKFVGTQATPLEVVTASKSITPWGAHRLLSLPPALLGHAWPAERGVMGLRVCKQIPARRRVVLALLCGGLSALATACEGDDAAGKNTLWGKAAGARDGGVQGAGSS